MNILGNCVGLLGFSIPIITELLILIDYGIYSIAQLALRGFFEVLDVSVNIFGGGGKFDEIYSIVQRAMVLAGIFALFKLSLTLITYIVNPDSINKASQMGTTLIRKVIIAVILILSSKFIFQKLGELQKIVFDSQIIQQIVYGDNANDADSMKDSKVAKQYVNSVWLQFFKPKEGTSSGDMSNCNTTYNKVGKGEAELIALIGCHYKYYDYLPIAPFVVGIILCYYFVTYSIELAIRMVKLLILEILYPIPVIMSIDLKKGDEKLKGYIGLYFGIYAQVFLRVLTLYLAFGLLSLITDFAAKGASQTLTGENNWFFNTVFLIGVFKGMKELPKLIEDAIGVKLSGGRAKSFGAALKGVIGGTTGLIAGAVAGGLTGGVGGAVLGGLRGVTGGAKDGQNTKNVGDMVRNAVNQAGRGTNAGKGIRSADGLFGYAGGMLNNKLGYNQRVDNRVNNATERKERLDKLNEAIMNDYANKVVNGRKVGTMEEDAGVLAAQVALDRYRRGEDGPITQAGLDALTSNLKAAQNNYKDAAYQNFSNNYVTDTGSGLEFKDGSGRKLDVKRDFADLSSSQRAFYEMLKYDGQNGLNLTNTGTYSSLDSAMKTAKTAVKSAEKEQKTLKYKHAADVANNTKK